MTRKIGAAAVLVLSLTIGATGCNRRDQLPKLETPPDIYLIVVDALRADHLNGYGYARDTDPALRRLAADSVVFEQAFVAAPKTIPSIPQILSSSLFPDARRATTLMEAAAAAGYGSSLAVINNPYVKKWVQRLEPTFTEIVAGEFSATEIVDRTLEWLTDPPAGPRMVYLHFLDSHTPYDVPPPFKSLFVDASYRGKVGLEFGDVAGAWSGNYAAADRRRIVDLYDGTIAYVDDQIGRLLTALVENGSYDDALIVVTADHGEEFWDHGSFFHGQSLYDELLRVPLIVKYPRGWHAGTRVDGLASSLDILPTIAAMMAATGTDPTDARWQGRRLARVIAPPDEAPERILFATVGRADRRRPPRNAVRSKSHKFIVNVVDGTRELYELDTDPLERRSVIAIGTEPPEELLTAYTAATEELRDVGFQFELTNAGRAKVSYDIELAVKPIAPLVNLHRLDLEKTDTIEISDNTSELRWTGRLLPEETDRIRFDLLAHEGDLHVKLTLDGHLAKARALRIGAQGKPVDANPAVISIGAVDGPPSTASSARHALRSLLPSEGARGPVTLAVWRTGDSQDVLPPALTQDEEARIRSLGYMD